MVKKLKIVCVIIIFILFLTACWDANELTDLALATALAIDQEDDQIKLTVQVINPDEIAGNNFTNRTAVSTYSSTGETVFEALRKLTTIAPRKVYLSHIHVIVIGEALAEAGIARNLDFISRDHEMRADFHLAIARGHTAAEAINILTPLEKISAEKLASSIESSQQAWAKTKKVSLDVLLSSISSKGKEAVLTGVDIIGDPNQGNKLDNVEAVHSPTFVKVDTVGVFKNDQLVGWLSGDDSKGLNYVINEVESTVEETACEEGDDKKVVAEVIKSNTKMEGKFKNDTPTVAIDIKTEANIGDVECGIDITDPSNFEKIEKQLGKEIEQLIKDSIDQAKELESDIFGFGEVISRSNYKRWKEIEGRWSDVFVQQLQTEVNVDVTLRRTGTVTQSFQKEIEEKKKKDEQ
ncbi:Ger(x)C family spore germination protein [Aquibacillus sediminis]|uniref:Ger(x)C family spore germination protein n=1 Tax=Aquibacillus sediminis TaxID=2574734 RepID=UPI00110940C9|nr:Ger(x)C family spore germination protein [Aquibacillus sediminis]